MRQVDNHTFGFHSFDHLPAFVGQAAFVDSVSRAGDVVVEEVRRGHHSKSRVEQDVDIRQVTVERMSALDAEKPGGYPWFSLATFEVARQTSIGLDQHQFASRRLGKL